MKLFETHPGENTMVAMEVWSFKREEEAAVAGKSSNKTPAGTRRGDDESSCLNFVAGFSWSNGSGGLVAGS